MVNVMVALARQLRGKPCRAATADLAVRTRITSLRRADVLVTCHSDPPRADSYAARKPRMVVEVLSPSNKGVSWQRKLEEYRRATGLVYILLIDPEVEQAIFLGRSGETWSDAYLEGRDGVVELPAIGCRLAMTDVYAGLPAPGDCAPA